MQQGTCYPTSAGCRCGAAGMVMLTAVALGTPAAADWRGLYLGGHAGYGWEGAVAADVVASSLEPLVPNLNPTLSTATPPFVLSVSPQSWFVGLQAGYNWQVGALVYGIEADISRTRLRAEASGTYAITGVTLSNDGENFAGTVHLTRTIDYFGTVRARAGLAGGAWLLYVTGGLAYAHIETTLVSTHVATLGPATFPPGYPEALNARVADSGVHWGYALGAGAEWAFAPQWSLKAEYVYLDAGGGTLSIPGTTLRDEGMKLHTARLGVNYRFRAH